MWFSYRNHSIIDFFQGFLYIIVVFYYSLDEVLNLSTICSVKNPPHPYFQGTKANKIWKITFEKIDGYIIVLGPFLHYLTLDYFFKDPDLGSKKITDVEPKHYNYVTFYLIWESSTKLRKWYHWKLYWRKWKPNNYAWKNNR